MRSAGSISVSLYRNPDGRLLRNIKQQILNDQIMEFLKSQWFRVDSRNGITAWDIDCYIFLNNGENKMAFDKVKFKKKMRTNGFTQKNIAEVLNVDIRTVSRWLDPKISLPSEKFIAEVPIIIKGFFAFFKTVQKSDWSFKISFK